MTTISPPASIDRSTTTPTIGTGWARCGIGAGLGGIVSFLMTGALVVDESAMADNAEIAELLTDKAPWVWAYQVVGVATALLVAVFAAGLHRRLSQQAPAQSLAPMLSVGGLFLTSALTLVGSGIATEMFHGLRQDTDALDPDTLAAQLAIFNTMGWVWVGAILATASVAVVGLRHDSVSRRLAIGSVVATAFVALTNITPFQYMAMPVVALWLVGAGISFARADR
ncbi:hypothetical protein [Actinospongicola halichondriae]|uniref:hypothetical protein n=1 Tax=Actinospongicola halichondriae TaxID=3236844 RepID=UPI003D4ABEEB